MALKSFIRPSRLAISWFNSSVEVLGASLCISSVECATDGPACNRFAATDSAVGGTDDFLYGDAFCGRIVTAGTACKVKKTKFIFLSKIKKNEFGLPFVCLFEFEINCDEDGGPGTLKL